MNILNLGLDNRALNKDSQLATRIKAYGDINGVDSYVVIVPSAQTKTVELSAKARVIPSGGHNKLTQLIGLKWRANWELYRHKYQVITVQDAYFVGFPAWLLAKFYRVGLEIQVHGFEKFYGLRKMLAKFILPRADVVRVVSQRLKARLIAEFNVRPEKITVIPIFNDNDINPEFVKDGYEKTTEGKFVFFTASRLVPVKNIDLQLEALASLAASGRNAYLKIAGNGSEENKLKEKAGNLGLSERVEFVGWQEVKKLEKYFIESDCFLLTSDSEGWCLAAVEAAAHGLPIIMTDVGLAGEVIKDNESGLVIPVGDKAKLVETMEKIIADSGLRRRLGSAALQAVKKLPAYQETLAMYLAGWQKAKKKIRRLLILTQKVDLNDDYLGFFHDWLKEFAIHYDRITVICLYKGEYELPKNIRVFGLGKEIKASRWKYILNFYRFIWKFRNDYEAVFVHMNPEYVVLGGIFWKLWRKKIILWFTHKSINWKLKIAARLADVILTAAPESYRLPYGQVQAVGHGIETEKFSVNKRIAQSGGNFNILYVGRISGIKNQKLLLMAADELVNRKNYKNIRIILIGAPVYPVDREYLAEFKRLANELELNSYVKFAGSVANRKIAEYYSQSDLTINLCPTGGIDKAVLESLASGVLAVVHNKAFTELLAGYPDLILDSAEPEELAEKIEKVIGLNQQEYSALAEDLKEKVIADFSLPVLAEKIVRIIASLKD